jgi:hypothetical protein
LKSCSAGSGWGKGGAGDVEVRKVGCTDLKLAWNYLASIENKASSISGGTLCQTHSELKVEYLLLIKQKKYHADRLRRYPDMSTELDVHNSIEKAEPAVESDSTQHIRIVLPTVQLSRPTHGRPINLVKLPSSIGIRVGFTRDDAQRVF